MFTNSVVNTHLAYARYYLALALAAKKLHLKDEAMRCFNNAIHHRKCAVQVATIITQLKPAVYMGFDDGEEGEIGRKERMFEQYHG